MKKVNKIMAFVIHNNKFLLLKGNANDPQFKESFWYVVTGGVEKEDKNLKEAVKREIIEETNLNIIKIESLNWIFKYKSLGKVCVEEVFVVDTENNNVILNEENIDYIWCSIDEFVDKIKWYGSKNKLKLVLNNILDGKKTFINTEIDIIN